MEDVRNASGIPSGKNTDRRKVLEPILSNNIMSKTDLISCNLFDSVLP